MCSTEDEYFYWLTVFHQQEIMKFLQPKQQNDFFWVWNGFYYEQQNLTMPTLYSSPADELLNNSFYGYPPQEFWTIDPQAMMTNSVTGNFGSYQDVKIEEPVEIFLKKEEEEDEKEELDDYPIITRSKDKKSRK